MRFRSVIAGDPRALTEDDLVAAIAEVITAARGSKVTIGIGDDAAAWRPSRSHLSVISTDALVEGVHFTRDTIAPGELGERALGAALSDLAAMGARPVLATIGLGLPNTISADFVCELYRGINSLAMRTRTTIAGGDIVRAGEIGLCVTVVGEVRGSHLKRRGGARPGDVIAVTGLLGASRAGLEIIKQPALLTSVATARDRAALEEAVRVHRIPQPRLQEGAWLAASTSVTAMMDISDGLSTDLIRMCGASGCSAELQTIPAALAAVYVAEQLGQDSDGFTLSAGEDFELLLAVRSRAFQYLARRFRLRFRRELHDIGTFNEGKGVFRRKGQTTERLESSGWDHLEARPI